MRNDMERRLREVLASYGANPARWPEAERDLLLPHLDAMRDEIDEARRIDALLDLAAAPAFPADRENRIMARITGSAATRKSLPRWSAALPLAASLALGIYLGAMGDLDPFLPAMVTGDVVSASDDDTDLSGVTEATDYSGELLS
ncbi:MAG: hypothetical protein ACREDX_08800 [Aestuariivirga sp.]